MLEPKNLEEDLEKLKTFLTENNVSLTMTDADDNYTDLHTGEIVISNNQPLEIILYTMLHEIGHYFLDHHHDTTTNVGTLIEEVLAWDRGYDIACALSIEIDDDRWTTLMEDCIRQYMEQ